MSYTILCDNLLIKQKVENLFSYQTRHLKRVIFINYLDQTISDILLDVYNVNIYCYPQPGNIDPYSLEYLQKKGAKIYFTDPINTNIYYVENKGFLLGSANFNYTKNVLKCYDKVKDIFIFIDDYLSINIDSIIRSLNINIMSEKDLVKFKEEHHIFWRTYEGFEYLIESIINTKYYIDLVDKNIKSEGIINNIIKNISNIFSWSTYNKLPKHINDKSVLCNQKYGVKSVDKKIIDNKNMNIYCLSKEDLFELLTNTLQSKKEQAKKRNLH